MSQKAKRRCNEDRNICDSQASQNSLEDCSQKKNYLLLSGSQFERKLNDTVINLLQLNTSRHSLSRAQVLSNFKNCRGADAAKLVEAVTKLLDWYFGLELVEVEKNKYILINKTSTKLLNEEGSKDKVLLLLILSSMYHGDQSIKADVLVSHFTSMGIKMKNDPYFGDIEKKMQELEKQMYIMKINSTDNEVIYKWGIRSEYEVSKTEFWEFMAKVHGCSVDSVRKTLDPLHSSQESTEVSMTVDSDSD